VIREVTRATYPKVWRPQFDVPLYVDELPVWNRSSISYGEPARHSATDERQGAVYLDNPTVTAHEYALAIITTVTKRWRWRLGRDQVQRNIMTP
jgi:hypothetical protein